MDVKKKKKFISVEEFIKKTIPCKNGRQCLDTNCIYLHNIKTKMCKFEDKCRRKNNCSFAHSKEELFIPPCRFGIRCRKQDCTFSHPKKIIPFIKPIEKKIENDEKNLESENFPIMDNVSKPIVLETIDYSEMKNIKRVDSATIKKDSIEEMVEEFKTIHEFKTLTFEF